MPRHAEAWKLKRPLSQNEEDRGVAGGGGPGVPVTFFVVLPQPGFVSNRIKITLHN